jgi:hypothetical protein
MVMVRRKNNSKLSKYMEVLFYDWKTAYFYLCISLIIITIFLTLLHILTIITYSYSGWDYDVYRSSIKVFNDGGNPYIFANLNLPYKSSFTYIYPPITIPFMSIICPFDSKLSYYIIWSIMLVATFLIVKRCDKNLKPLFLTTVLTTGFLATYWNFISGNIGLLELLFFSLTFYWIIKERYDLSTVSISLIAVFKLTPISFVGSFIFTRASRLNKIKIFGLMVFLFAIIHILSYILYPNLSKTYFWRVQTNENIFEIFGKQASPALFLLFKDISYLFFADYLLYTFILYFLFIGFVGILFLTYIQKQNRKFLEIFSLSTIAIMIILPRLKPYSFVYALLPVYFLIKDSDYKVKFYTLMIISAFPLVFRITSCVFIDLYSNIFFKYHQPLSLFFFFIYFLILDHTFQLFLVKLKKRILNLKSLVLKKRNRVSENKNVSDNI